MEILDLRGGAGISVVTEPDNAEVSLNGESLGTSTISQVIDSGVHKLKISKKGYITREIGINIESGFRLTVWVALALDPYPKTDKLSEKGKFTLFELPTNNTNLNDNYQDWVEAIWYFQNNEKSVPKKYDLLIDENGKSYPLVINLVLSLRWELSFSAYQIFSLPFIQYSSNEDLMLVNSISSLVMSLVLAFGFTLILFRFQFFHEDFIPPKIASILHSKKMDRLIINKSQSHNQLTTWFILAWVTFVVILLEFIGGSVSLIVLIFNLTMVSLINIVLIFDMLRKGATAKARHK